MTGHERWCIDDPRLEQISEGWWWLLIGDGIDPPSWFRARIELPYLDRIPYAHLHERSSGGLIGCSTIHQHRSLLIARKTGTVLSTELRIIVSAAPCLTPDDVLTDHQRALYRQAMDQLIGKRERS